MSTNKLLSPFLTLSGVLAAGAPMAQDGANVVPSPTDVAIADAIQDELNSDLAVPSADVDVTVQSGVVTLAGSIDNILAKERAVRIAETVRGVRSVLNRLDVIPAVGRTDADIRHDVKRALLEDPATDSYEIEVAVVDGTVTLSGAVDSYAERALCNTVAKGVKGVVGVKDDMTVHYKSVRPDSEIAAEVHRTLLWDEFVDHALMNVVVDDGVVAISGIAGSAAEKRRAASLAWVAGVKSVDDKGLTVARWARDDDLRTSKYVARSDAELRQAVQAAMVYDPRVAAFRVVVDAHAGVVTLRGSVDNLAARRAAEQDARNTVGVWSVTNRLKVRPRVGASDTAIAARVREALERDPYVERHPLTLHVRNGVVYLYGTVDSHFERAQADEIVARTQGVLEVENHVDVKNVAARPFDPYVDPGMPRAYPVAPYHGYWPDTYATATMTDEMMVEEIQDELWWSPFVDGDQVNVMVEDGVATLTGTVESWSEFTVATENAYEGGAVRVRNRLRVNGRKQ